jgi:hypothetical protein
MSIPSWPSFGIVGAPADELQACGRPAPRTKRTNKTNSDRISCVLGVEIEGRPLREWELDEIRRRQVLALVDHMLREEGRAAQGVRLGEILPLRRPDFDG